MRKSRVIKWLSHFCRLAARSHSARPAEFSDVHGLTRPGWRRTPVSILCGPKKDTRNWGKPVKAFSVCAQWATSIEQDGRHLWTVLLQVRGDLCCFYFEVNSIHPHPLICSRAAGAERWTVPSKTIQKQRELAVVIIYSQNLFPLLPLHQLSPYPKCKNISAIILRFFWILGVSTQVWIKQVGWNTPSESIWLWRFLSIWRFSLEMLRHFF